MSEESHDRLLGRFSTSAKISLFGTLKAKAEAPLTSGQAVRSESVFRPVENRGDVKLLHVILHETA